MAITINNSTLSASFSEKGAELVSLKDASGKEYMWSGDPAFWGKHSPVLFPIVGTLKDGSYFFNDRKFELGRHGFARDLPFTLEASGTDFAHFALEYNAETLAKYPFRFKFSIHYTLKDAVLDIKYTVENKGEDEMYFSLGAHPAFAVEGDLERYAIQMGEDVPLHFNLLKNDLLSYETEELDLVDGAFTLNDALFERDALIFRHIPCKSLSLLKDGNAFLKVDFDPFEDLGIWKKTGAGFICIEPWSGYSDPVDANGNLSEKPGIIAIEGHKAYEAAFQITVL